MRRYNRKNKPKISPSKDSLSDAKSYALKLISIRPRSKRELIDRLLSRGYSNQITEEVIKDLSKVDLINDSALTEQLINHGLRDKGLGIRGIRNLLEKRGIDRELIENADLNAIDEYPQALKIANKIKQSNPNIPTDKLKRKIFGYLQRRGYSYDTIKDVLKNIQNQR